MATRFSKVFSLTDIFNNRDLRKQIPLINYKEKELPSGKISARTNRKTVIRLIYDNARSEGRHHYKPLESSWKGDRIEIGGTLVTSLNEAYEGMLWRMKTIKQMISLTANDSDMIRDALKEAEKNKRTTGEDSALYLRVQSMEQIQGMSEREIRGLMDNVMENIYFSESFQKTQKKYGIREKGFFLDGRTYEEHQAQWEKKVGI